MGRWNGVELDGLVLNSARLILRPWQESDVPAIVAIMADPAMHQFLPLPNPYSEADAVQYVSETAPADVASGTGFTCALVERSSGAIIGSAALRAPAPRTTAAEIGYWVAGAAQGNGYASEAARALATWAFDRAAVTRTEIRCAVENVASAKVALNSGFRFEGIRRAAGVTPDGPADEATFGRVATDRGDPFPSALPRLPAGGITDGTLSLRTLTRADAPALIEQLTNAEAVRWQFADSVASEPTITEQAARSELEWMVGPLGRLTIVEVASGVVVGTMVLRNVGPPQIANLGYGVLPAYRGRGHTSRALRLLTEWAFGPGNLARLELGTKPGNVASQRSAAASGFEFDGIRDSRLRNRDGTFSDEVRFALVNPRYKSGGAGHATPRTRSIEPPAASGP
jgi:RimJ/RimL family protein N-acetyltransferase